MKTTKKELREQIISIRESIQKEDKELFLKMVSKFQRELQVNKTEGNQYRGYVPNENILKLSQWKELLTVHTIALDIINSK